MGFKNVENVIFSYRQIVDLRAQLNEGSLESFNEWHHLVSMALKYRRKGNKEELLPLSKQIKVSLSKKRTDTCKHHYSFAHFWITQINWYPACCPFCSMGKHACGGCLLFLSFKHPLSPLLLTGYFISFGDVSSPRGCTRTANQTPFTKIDVLVRAQGLLSL